MGTYCSLVTVFVPVMMAHMGPKPVAGCTYIYRYYSFCKFI